MTEAHFRKLSHEEARHALYIDFEGGQDQPPVVLGILRRRGLAAEPYVHQLVVDPDFADVGPEACGLREAVDIVVRRADHGGRRIVSWSEHDLGVVRTLRDEDPKLVERFERHYANAAAVARRWTNKLHRDDRPVDGRLAEYLIWIGYDVPPGAEPGNVGETIRALRPRLRSGRPLTATQEQRWARLLAHNAHDCAGMRSVCLRATAELERAEQERR